MASRPIVTSIAKHWNDAYSNYEHLPWDTDGLPVEIREITDRLSKCSRILDVGCGRGLHAIELAAQGFDVTGIDLSDIAINQAISSAASSGTLVDFRCVDAIDFVANEPFDIIIDYSVFHHVSIDHREQYSKRCVANMAVGGQLVIVCYSNEDPIAQGRSTRMGAMGNLIAHPTLEEVSDLFTPELDLVAQRTTKLGVEVYHDAHHLVFRKGSGRTG